MWPSTAPARLLGCRYGPTGEDIALYNYPAFTIEAKTNRPVRVKFTNELYEMKDGKLETIPHILPVDATYHWANFLRALAPPKAVTDSQITDTNPCMGICTVTPGSPGQPDEKDCFTEAEKPDEFHLCLYGRHARARMGCELFAVWWCIGCALQLAAGLHWAAQPSFGPLRASGIPNCLAAPYCWSACVLQEGLPVQPYQR